MGDLAREKRVGRELLAQPRQQQQRARIVFLPNVCNREQDAGKGREVVSMRGGGLQVRYSTLFIRRQPSHSKNPAHRGRHTSDDVFAETRRQQSVIAIGTDRQQLLRRGRRLPGEVQGRQIALFNERRVIGLQACR
jgi:hypothetical protein